MNPSLADVLATLWRLLDEGARARDSAFRQAFLATIDETGHPQARTVTLRGADSVSATLRFNCDIRSPKADQIQADPRVSLLFYSPADRVQIRAMGTATLHHGDNLARGVWDSIAGFSRRCYLAPLPPGTPTSDATPNFPDVYRKRSPLPEESAAGFANFAVAIVQVRELDYYQIHSSHPWRAGFRRAENTAEFNGEWRMP